LENDDVEDSKELSSNGLRMCFSEEAGDSKLDMDAVESEIGELRIDVL
jgi:hypothetical protein